MGLFTVMCVYVADCTETPTLSGRVLKHLCYALAIVVTGSRSMDRAPKFVYRWSGRSEFGSEEEGNMIGGAASGGRRRHRHHYLTIHLRPDIAVLGRHLHVLEATAAPWRFSDSLSLRSLGPFGSTRSYSRRRPPGHCRRTKNPAMQYT